MSSTYSSSVASSSSTGFTSISASSSTTSLLSDVEKIGILDALLDKVKPTPPKAPDAKGKGRADPTADLLSRIADWSTASTLPPQQQLLIRLVLISEAFDHITTIPNVESRTRLIAWLTRTPSSDPATYRDLAPEHWEMIFRFGVAGMSVDERDSFWARFVSVLATIDQYLSTSGVFCLDVAFNHLPLWSPRTVESGRLRTVPIRSLSNAIAFGDSKLESTTGIISIDLRLSQWISAGGGGADVPLSRVTELALYDDTPDEAKIVYIPNLDRLSDLKTLKLDNFFFPAKGNKDDFAPLVQALRPTVRTLFIRTWKKHRLSRAFVIDLLSREIPFENIDLVYSDTVVSDPPYGNLPLLNQDPAYGDRRSLPGKAPLIDCTSLKVFKCGPLTPADIDFLLSKFKFAPDISFDFIIVEPKTYCKESDQHSRKVVTIPMKLSAWMAKATSLVVDYDTETGVFTIQYGIRGSFMHRLCMPDALGLGVHKTEPTELWRDKNRLKRFDSFTNITTARFVGPTPDFHKWCRLLGVMKKITSLEASGPEASVLLHTLKRMPNLGTSLLTLKVWDISSPIHVLNPKEPKVVSEGEEAHISLIQSCLIAFFSCQQRNLAESNMPHAASSLLCAARYNDEDATVLCPPNSIFASSDLETDALFRRKQEAEQVMPVKLSNPWFILCSTA
ncbi:hypothetical protein SISSUDRAFT_1077567 [Sistotremastrum suecicum HHB10207 ss-3]|uniref:Uncharacterized protein n=1 Tax=Sistotremastrum suecicum HHB10207 ss-3 TaxID=1314776 RepID=A0A166AZT4_9AGAM|nr:hypothetical protein SISSUDRAFT_1077567 [Sistotremastrum suecicum HHB10207 ss-3]